MLNEIQNLSREFFEKLGIDISKLEVVKEEENIFFIKLETKDSAILIWKYWVNFEAVQNLLRSIFSNKYDEKIKIHFEINDYIHNKDAKLFAFIDKEIARAKETWRNMKLPYLNAYERKKVHDYVSKLEDKEIKTESRWEKKDRRLYIILTKNDIKKESTKHKKLEIDIDSIDI